MPKNEAGQINSLQLKHKIKSMLSKYVFREYFTNNLVIFDY